jgi:hypothetical protein
MCIVSKQENGKRVLILKNSFGNAISPYFVSHFERTYIADYRYFKCNLKDFIEKNRITDLVIFHNSFSANTPSHVDMLKQIAKSETVCVAHTLPSWEELFPEGKLMAPVLEKHNKEHSKDSLNTKTADTGKEIKKNKEKKSPVEKEKKDEMPIKESSEENGG